MLQNNNQKPEESEENSFEKVGKPLNRAVSCGKPEVPHQNSGSDNIQMFANAQNKGIEGNMAWYCLIQ